MKKYFTFFFYKLKITGDKGGNYNERNSGVFRIIRILEQQ